MLHIVSFSGGKDSTAMLLHMMELNYPIDEVINFDTRLEFPAMYEHIEKVRKVVEDAGIKFTVLRSDKTFEYYAFEHEYTSPKNNKKYKGYGWSRGKARWCTSLLKVVPSRKYFKEHFENEKIVQYVGIAADEQYRLERESNKAHEHPLVDWGWTEKDALKYCYDKGYDFGGLYEIFDRVSCWCCPLQKLSELRKLYENFPELWQQLLVWEGQTDMPFKLGWTLKRLEARFQLESDYEKLGLEVNTRSKKFQAALRERTTELPPPVDTRLGSNTDLFIQEKLF